MQEHSWNQQSLQQIWAVNSKTHTHFSSLNNDFSHFYLRYELTQEQHSVRTNCCPLCRPLLSSLPLLSGPWLPFLHPHSRSHTRATFQPCSCWEDVSLWLQVLWEIPTARPFSSHVDHWGKEEKKFAFLTGQQAFLASNLLLVKTFH